MIKTLRMFLYYWLPVIIWAGFIFYLSNQPGLKSSLAWPYDFILRKGAHIVEFAVLFLLLLRALEKGHNLATKKALGWAFVLTIFYAVSDEYHQSFVAQRVASLTDVAIDSLGVLLIIWRRLRRFF
ncbi:MAG: hypothetical protein CO002_01580 [Candidatus Portnoybacteria bacterium CG_4_8_14_3_um_filter_44_10]|uniref:VanZ-like domain-containing protein n=4 Tax=Candidatus Portnoyibacteriota TaxID=1817913 RepID=A0A2H0KPZ2_9BACT|nr:MAG: hypothetical protein AUK17_01560 [Parcubacteria group bacterium CG2_30_44_18]PIQ74231.1 MAG: hypothetical protein COV85_03315 [Candidatus Portnoybacteria bacterium CG11_big_fil_rev_8_21_14_0_20_44_10]PIS16271.1 MAG: hypothetical protein COT61_04775 [Candidatus Portnoybacteria bacterium CG09_land_8_20_14_0_10_44_13]PIW75515.1 MAG: hypothetical protein CO002_01580 [Candidatus Portnoybacteria bacterium CG_4_8_14_3_um_filter_44_10]PIZ68744.1 MAG: hypothetical protein COY11_05660 [Candidatus